MLTSALNDQGKEPLESQSKLQQLNKELKNKLNDLIDENENLKVKIEQDRKKNQQPDVTVLDEISSDGKDKEIQKLQDELEVALEAVKEQNELIKQAQEKDEKILEISQKLEQAQEKIKNIENQSEQKAKELSEELQIAQEKLKETRDELNKNNELIDQLRDGNVSKKLFAKLQSERDKLKNDLTVKEKQLDAINNELEQAQKESESIKGILEALQDQLHQQEKPKTTTDEGSQTKIEYSNAKTQTNVEQNEVGTETELPQDNQDMQTTMVQRNPIIKKLRQENTGLIKDKQIKQKPVKVNASTTTDRKETIEMGTQTDTRPSAKRKT